MLYALILVCSSSAQMCTGVEDTQGPYETMEACQARIVEMNEAIPSTLIPMLQQQGIRGPFSGQMICDTLPNIRENFSDAFEGEEVQEDIEA